MMRRRETTGRASPAAPGGRVRWRRPPPPRCPGRAPAPRPGRGPARGRRSLGGAPVGAGGGVAGRAAALGATQLNATASVPGTFVYSPAAGAVLGVGTSWQLTATFTPADTTTYLGTTTTVSIAVVKATPVITWATPADIVYPTPLSALQ